MSNKANTPPFASAQAYEYARSMVEAFIATEEMLAGPQAVETVYGDSSLLRTIFTTDYSYIVDDQDVKHRIETILTPESRSEPHFAALTRLRVLYTHLVTSLGTDMINSMIDALAAGIASARGYTNEKALSTMCKDVKAFIGRFPVVLPCVLGAPAFTARLLAVRSSAAVVTQQPASQNSQFRGTSRTGL